MGCAVKEISAQWAGEEEKGERDCFFASQNADWYLLLFDTLHNEWNINERVHSHTWNETVDWDITPIYSLKEIFILLMYSTIERFDIWFKQNLISKLFLFILSFKVLWISQDRKKFFVSLWMSIFSNTHFTPFISHAMCILSLSTKFNQLLAR